MKTKLYFLLGLSFVVLIIKISAQGSITQKNAAYTKSCSDSLPDLIKPYIDSLSRYVAYENSDDADQ